MNKSEKFVLDIVHLSWAIVAADGTVRQMAMHDSEDALAAISDGLDVIALVPADAVTVMPCHLPKMNVSKLRRRPRSSTCDTSVSVDKKSR